MDLFIGRSSKFGFLYHKCIHFYRSRQSLGQLGLCILLLTCLLVQTAFADSFALNPEILQKTEQQSGPEAKQRILDWQALINNNIQGHTDLEKLALVNQFFNKIPYKPDQETWSQERYWATPLEFLSKNAGDCEDYAFAKYYTLIKLGIAPDKMRLAYVKSLKLHQAHMVLTYYETPKQEPLILDSLRSDILYASERPDLLPVYSINAEGMWMTPTLSQDSAQKVGTSNRMRVWLDLQERMAQDGLK